MIRSFFKRTPATRLCFFILGDASLILTSLWLALLLRFEGTIPPYSLAALQAVFFLALAAKIPVLYFMRTYRFSWAFVSIREALTLFKACTLGSLLFSTALFFTKHDPTLSHMPRSIPILDFAISFLLIGGFRCSKRIYLSYTRYHSNGGRKRTLIVGAGDAGEQLLRSLLHVKMNPYAVRGFVDDNPFKRGCSIHGFPILGSRQEIPQLVYKWKIETLLIALPSAGSEVIRDTVDLARKSGIQDIRTLPVFSDIVSGRIRASDIREIRLEDLLGRQPVQVDTAEMADYFRGKVVLVTGAAGSIGSELCRQLFRFSMRSLILVDQDETALFNIHRELTQQDSHEVHYVLGNIQDRQKMSGVLSRFRPHIILHSAAFKHVRIMDAHPDEAIKNNVRGTLNMGELACEMGVERFVLISTDKAVNPTGVMGASKRVAEIICMNLNKRGSTHFMAVRFGNVLGSRGSVLPILSEQLQKGVPLTITDPRMKRYFMIPSEACLLVLQAAVMGKGGEVFVLDMGQPVKILDLVNELIRFAGLDPQNVPIKFTGAAPEEKLFEDILTAEEGTVATQNNRIFRAQLSSSLNPAEFEKNVAKIITLAERAKTDQIIATLKGLLPTYQPPLEKLALSQNQIETDSDSVPITLSVSDSSSHTENQKIDPAIHIQV
ncbi:MAG: polysaccharide biosynthesis protein [Elusimicrobia bacterium]|nr:polysaccharide biosynthesis protein [Elusimicrobiota bacterium]